MKSLGTTSRGLTVHAPGHPSYSGLERVRLLAVPKSDLASIARQSHPSFRAVDHEDAAMLHYQAKNFHAARAHQAASEAMSMSKSKKTAADDTLGITSSGKTISMGSVDRYKGIKKYPAQNHRGYQEARRAASSGGQTVYDRNRDEIIRLHPDFTAKDHLEAANMHAKSPARHNGKMTKRYYMERAHSDAAAEKAKPMQKSEPGSGKLARNLGRDDSANGEIGKTRSGKSILSHTSSKYASLNHHWDSRSEDYDAHEHVKMGTHMRALHPDWSPADHADAVSKYRESPGFDSGAHQAHHFAAQMGGAHGPYGAAFHAKAASEYLSEKGKMKRPFTDSESRKVGKEIYKHAKKNPSSPGLSLDEAARRISPAKKLGGRAVKKSLAADATLGTAISGMPIAPPYASDLQWIYAGLDPATGLDDAATAIQTVTPDWTPQDHADHGAAYHALALSFANAQTADDRAKVCAAAAFMHFAAAGINPAINSVISKSFLMPDWKAKPRDDGPSTAADHPKMTARDHENMARTFLRGGNTKQALRHMQAASFLERTKVKKASRKPLGAAFSHARKVEQKTGGGAKKKRAVATRFINQRGFSSLREDDGH